MDLLFQLTVDEIFKTAMAEKKLDDIFRFDNSQGGITKIIWVSANSTSVIEN